jgi:hypothetical protein
MMMATSGPQEVASSLLLVHSIRLALKGQIQGWMPSEPSPHAACLEPSCLNHPQMVMLWRVLSGDCTFGLLWWSGSPDTGSSLKECATWRPSRQRTATYRGSATPSLWCSSPTQREMFPWRLIQNEWLLEAGMPQMRKALGFAPLTVTAARTELIRS